MDFVSGGKRTCGYRQTAENEAGGEELPFRAHEKDFLQRRRSTLSLSVRAASRTDGILVPTRTERLQA